MAGQKAIGTVIGAVLLAVLLVALIGFIFYMIDQMQSLYSQLSNIAGTKASAALLASGITGWYENNATTLHIHLESRLPFAVQVTTVSAVWSDDTYTVYDHVNTPATGFTATVNDTSTVYTVDRLPIPLGPDYTADIYIDNGGKNVKTVAVTLSSSPVVAVVPLKSYEELYGTGGGATASIVINASVLGTLAGHLERAAYDWTKTWLGTVTGKYYVQVNGNITGYTVVTGTATSGDAASLETVDGNVMSLDSAVSLVPVLSISQDNLIYATDFEAGDPFASGEWTTVGGSWSWAGNIGYGGSAGIQQTDTGGGGGIADGNEYVAYPTGDYSAQLLQPYYVMSQVEPLYSSYNDIVLFEKSTGNIYELSIHPAASAIEIWSYAGGWNQLTGTSASVNTNQWYTSLVYYDPSTGYIDFTVIDESGSSWSVSYTDTSVSPDMFAVGTWRSSAAFDNLIVSHANPRYINVSLVRGGSPVPGWTVKLYDGSGNLVAEATTGSDGVAVLDVTWHPIVRGAYFEVYDSSNNLVGTVYASESLGTDKVYGGNAYRIDLIDVYMVELEVSSTVDLASALEVGVRAVFTATTASSTAVNYTLLFYNTSSGAWQVADSGSVSSGSTVDVSSVYSPSSGVADTGTGEVRLRLRLYSTSSLTASVDMANAFYTYTRTETFYALLVAAGGSTGVDVYDIGSGSPAYLYTIEASTVFDGNATIAYDPVAGALLLVNASGVYATPISPTPSWSLVTSGCNASSGVEAEVLVNGGQHKLVVLRGGGGDEWCTVDLSDNTTSTGTLTSSLGETAVVDTARVYPASAASGSTGYFLAYSIDAGKPVIVMASLSSSGTVSWARYNSAPGGYATGLAPGSQGVWLLLERGGLYMINATSTVQLNATLAFTPWGPGDRLEQYNSTMLLFVRADSTDEVWLIPVQQS